MGDIHRKFGRTVESAAAYHRALGILEPLQEAAPGDPEVRRAWRSPDPTWVISRLAAISATRRRYSTSKPENILDPLAFPPNTAAAPVDRLLLARTLRGKAELLRRQGDIKAASQQLRALASSSSRLLPPSRKIPSFRATSHRRTTFWAESSANSAT